LHDRLEAVDLITEDTSVIMLYGSHARRTANSSSDIDVLMLVDNNPGSAVSEEISVVRYLPSQIEAMVAARSLFAWHLAREGQCFGEVPNPLTELLAKHPGPDPRQTLATIRELSPVLDVSEAEFRTAPSMRQVVRYLVRSAIYSKAIEAGTSSFELRAAALAVDPSGAVQALAARATPASAIDWPIFVHLRNLLAEFVEGLLTNEYGSLDALVVRSLDTNPALSNLALFALSEESDEIPYAATNMPIL